MFGSSVIALHCAEYCYFFQIGVEKAASGTPSRWDRQRVLKEP